MDQNSIQNQHSSDDNEHTSSSLIHAAQADDHEAWRRLTDLYGPLVYHWCLQMGLGHADAADVIQDVFVSVSKSLDRFTTDSKRGSFRGWLWTITRRKGIDFFRKNSERAVAMGGTDAQLQMASLPDELTEESSSFGDRSVTANLFHRGLELIKVEFEPRTWQAFWRSAVDQVPTSEIAEELSMSRAAVRKAKSRILLRLRTVLGD